MHGRISRVGKGKVSDAKNGDRRKGKSVADQPTNQPANQPTKSGKTEFVIIVFLTSRNSALCLTNYYGMKITRTESKIFGLRAISLDGNAIVSLNSHSAHTILHLQ